jgi:hypothetical protein
MKHNCKVTFTYAVEIAEVESCFEVTANRTPGDPGCWYLPNGDPGYPPEPGEIEILSVKGSDGKEIPQKEWEVFLNEDSLIDRAGEIDCPHENDDPPDSWEPRNVSQQDDPHDD